MLLPTEMIHFKDKIPSTELLHSPLRTHIACVSGNTFKKRDINFLKQIQREIRVTQRAHTVSGEELFKELEMLKLQKKRLRENTVTACTYVRKELTLLLLTIKI